MSSVSISVRGVVAVNVRITLMFPNNRAPKKTRGTAMSLTVNSLAAVVLAVVAATRRLVRGPSSSVSARSAYAPLRNSRNRRRYRRYTSK